MFLLIFLIFEFRNDLYIYDVGDWGKPWEHMCRTHDSEESVVEFGASGIQCCCVQRNVGARSYFFVSGDETNVRCVRIVSCGLQKHVKKS